MFFVAINATNNFVSVGIKSKTKKNVKMSFPLNENDLWASKYSIETV